MTKKTKKEPIYILIDWENSEATFFDDKEKLIKSLAEFDDICMDHLNDDGLTDNISVYNVKTGKLVGVKFSIVDINEENNE